MGEEIYGFIMCNLSHKNLVQTFFLISLFKVVVLKWRFSRSQLIITHSYSLVWQKWHGCGGRQSKYFPQDVWVLFLIICTYVTAKWLKTAKAVNMSSAFDRKQSWILGVPVWNIASLKVEKWGRRLCTRLTKWVNQMAISLSLKTRRN